MLRREEAQRNRRSEERGSAGQRTGRRERSHVINELAGGIDGSGGAADFDSSLIAVHLDVSAALGLEPAGAAQEQEGGPGQTREGGRGCQKRR